MAVMLDASYLVSFVHTKDVHYVRAKEIGRLLASGKYGEIFILDYVFDEFVTVIKRKTGKKFAVECGNKLLNDPLISVTGMSGLLFENAWRIFSKYDSFSFTDAAIVAIMHNAGINELVSFDEDFDDIAFVERIS